MQAGLNQAQMMVMTDLEEPFVPLSEGLFVDPYESKYVLANFCFVALLLWDADRRKQKIGDFISSKPDTHYLFPHQKYRVSIASDFECSSFSTAANWRQNYLRAGQPTDIWPRKAVRATR